MKKLICFFTIFVFWGITDSMAQGLHFGVKAGVLGNKANISGMRDQFKEESLTGFQVGPMLQYQTGFHGIALDFSLLYVERGIKLTNTSNRRSADIKTQSIDIPIELKWEMGISNNFDLFLGWRSTEVGLNLGGGVKIVNHLMVSCYYNIGLTQSAKHNIGGNKHDAIDQIFDGDVFESKNRYWQLSLAYVF